MSPKLVQYNNNNYYYCMWALYAQYVNIIFQCITNSCIYMRGIRAFLDVELESTCLLG